MPAFTCRSTGKKVKGRKRHIVTDTQSRTHRETCFIAWNHAADIQDRDGAPMVIEGACENWPRLVHLFADGGYAGWKLELALLQKMDHPPALEIVRRPNAATGFVVITKRWVVERTFAWLRAVQAPYKELGNVHILIKRMAHNCSNQTTIQICRKTNEIKHLILSQTLKKSSRQLGKIYVKDFGWWS